MKTLNEPEELTDKEHEQEHFELLIDECMCNNLRNVCLCNLINEEKKKQDEVRENAKHLKDNIFMEKVSLLIILLMIRCFSFAGTHGLNKH